MREQETSPAQPRRRLLLIPEYDPYEADKRYPGGIEPGSYTRNEVVGMLRGVADDPQAVRFVADILEE